MPLSPVSSTVDAGLAATFCSSAFDVGDRRGCSPTMRSRLYGCAWLRAQRAHFAPQPRRFERLLDEQRDLVEVERLVGVVIRAVLHRLDGRLDARVRGQQDDQRVGVALLDLLEDRQAVAVRQLVVEQHEVDAFGVALERRRGGVGLDDAIAFLREPLGQRPANQLLVVDDENRRRLHGMGLVYARRQRHRSTLWRPAWSSSKGLIRTTDAPSAAPLR